MSSIFEQIKDKVSILEVVPFYTEDVLNKIGEHTYEMSDHSCPLCGHNDCFRIKHTDEESYFHCFSCDKGGDLIRFVSLFKTVVDKLPSEMSEGEAARLIAKDFNIKLITKKLSSSERILNEAAQYYHSRLLDSTDDIDGMTPLEYQTKKRHHKVGTLVDFNVGYTDGKLSDFLLSVGFDLIDLVASGITRVDDEGKYWDFYKEGLFTYPQYVEGVCSHISQKDPRKKEQYQLPGKFRLNDVLFFNQDDIKKDKVYIVEGQNDVLSLYDAKADAGLIGTNGSISSKQLDWIQKNLSNKKVYTIFDPDKPGDTYRSKIKKVLPNSVHIKLPETLGDIDDFLGAGKTLTEAFGHVVEVSSKEETSQMADESRGAESVNVGVYDADTNVLEKNGCYYKVKTSKDGEDQLVILTDFTIKMRNIFLIEGKRLREIEVIRNDGFKSNPLLIDSETKVSMKAFKAKIADACDGAYYGSDSDLLSIWKYVYKKGTERTVEIPDHVGCLKDRPGGWLLRNMYIRPTGEIIERDRLGVMWISGNSRGIRPKSLSSPLEVDVHSKKSKDVPALSNHFSEEEMEAFESIFVTNFAKNLGNVGHTLLLLGWARMNAFSENVFETYDFVPFIFAWGGNGTGKTTLLHWILSLYNMKETGYTTLPNLKSGVGFERKLSYYSSLPVCVDELRASKEMHEFAGRFRSWYNRTGRDKAASGSHNEIIHSDVKANFILGGQDMITDEALRQRCVVVRISKDNREKEESYAAINMLENEHKLSAIGFKWIMESMSADMDSINADIKLLCSELVRKGVDLRNAWVWAILHAYGEPLARKHFPGFNFREYVLTACKEDAVVQSDSGLLNKFYETLEGIISSEHSPITCEHVRVDKNKLCIWFVEVFRIMQSLKRDYTEETFTKDAVRSAMKEEPYFQADTTIKMGKDMVSRRVVVFNLADETMPLALRNIAEVARRL